MLLNVDFVITGAYLLLCLLIGLLKFDKIKTLKDFTLGPRGFSTVVLFATTFATIVSSRTTINVTEKAFSMGLIFILPLLLEPVG